MLATACPSRCLCALHTESQNPSPHPVAWLWVELWLFHNLSHLSRLSAPRALNLVCYVTLQNSDLILPHFPSPLTPPLPRGVVLDSSLLLRGLVVYLHQVTHFCPVLATSRSRALALPAGQVKR